MLPYKREKFLQKNRLMKYTKTFGDFGILEEIPAKLCPISS